MAGSSANHLPSKPKSRPGIKPSRNSPGRHPCWRHRERSLGKGIIRHLPLVIRNFIRFPHHVRQVRHGCWTTPPFCANLLPTWARPEAKVGWRPAGQNCGRRKQWEQGITGAKCVEKRFKTRKYGEIRGKHETETVPFVHYLA